MSLSAADGVIRQSADVVRGTRSDLTSLITQLRGDIESIPRHGFDGRAAMQFQTLMARWNEDANKLIGALDGFERDLLSTQQSYEQTDEDRAASLNIETSHINFTYPGA